jgi:hypothetical protein
MAWVEARVGVFDVDPVERELLDRAHSVTGAEVIVAPGGGPPGHGLTWFNPT